MFVALKEKDREEEGRQILAAGGALRVTAEGTMLVTRRLAHPEAGQTHDHTPLR